MMPDPAQLPDLQAAGGFLLVLSIFIPIASVLLAFVAGGRNVERIALATLPVGLAIAVAIAAAKGQTAAPIVYLVGGWAPPLGVALRADGSISGHADDCRSRDLRSRHLCARGFPDAFGVGGDTSAIRVLDLAAGDLERAEPHLPRR